MALPASQQLPPKCYERLRRLVYEHSRINLGDKKLELVQSRLAKRLRALEVKSYEAYCDLVESKAGDAELEHLINAISTNHTFFFREAAHFDFMTHRVLPEFVASGAKHPFRLWSAASSSGEEAYTLAIVLSEFSRQRQKLGWSIECTDISSRILESASRAIYPHERLQKIERETLRRYFQKGQNKWEGFFRVKAELRNQVHFQRLNLLKPPYPFNQPFEVIFCRNVMIYFDRPTQEELVGHLSQFLVPGGYLMIGHSESLTGIDHKLHTVQPAIYQKPLR